MLAVHSTKAGRPPERWGKTACVAAALTVRTLRLSVGVPDVDMPPPTTVLLLPDDDIFRVDLLSAPQSKHSAADLVREVSGSGELDRLKLHSFDAHLVRRRLPELNYVLAAPDHLSARGQDDSIFRVGGLGSTGDVALVESIRKASVAGFDSSTDFIQVACHVTFPFSEHPPQAGRRKSSEREVLWSLPERSDIDYKTISNVARQHTLESLVHLLDRNHLHVGGDAVLRTEIQHLLGL